MWLASSAASPSKRAPPGATAAGDRAHCEVGRASVAKPQLPVRDVDLVGAGLQEHCCVDEQLGTHAPRRAEDGVRAHDGATGGERPSTER